MVNILLCRGWKIKSDSRNYILVRMEGGREFPEGYFGTLECAIEEFIERKMKLSEASSVFALIQYVKALQSSLNRQLQPLKLKVVQEISSIEKASIKTKGEVRGSEQTTLNPVK